MNFMLLKLSHSNNGKSNFDLECSHYCINTDRIVKNLEKDGGLLDFQVENFLFKNSEKQDKHCHFVKSG